MWALSKLELSCAVEQGPLQGLMLIFSLSAEVMQYTFLAYV